MNTPSFYLLGEYKYRVSDESGFPFKIGGRDTDVEQLAFSVEHLVREAYPINGVPVLQVERLAQLTRAAKDVERLIEMIVEDICISKLPAR